MTPVEYESRCAEMLRMNAHNDGEGGEVMNLAQRIIAALSGPQWAAIAEAKRRIELQALHGNRRHTRGNEGDKARKHGIPKRFRQYAKRYGNKGIDDIVQMHAQFPVPHINHARDEMSRRHGHAMLKILKKERAARTAKVGQ